MHTVYPTARCGCVFVQDELDAYDAHQKELEERMDEKTAALIHLQVTFWDSSSASCSASPFYNLVPWQLPWSMHDCVADARPSPTRFLH